MQQTIKKDVAEILEKKEDLVLDINKEAEQEKLIVDESEAVEMVVETIMYYMSIYVILSILQLSSANLSKSTL